MWCSGGVSKPGALQVHAVVERPLASGSLGRISLSAVGQDPILFSWQGPHEVQTDDTGSEAYGIREGMYTVHAEDDQGSRATLNIPVSSALQSTVIVREYRVTHASDLHMRDGSVEALGSEHLESMRCLWSNGVTTQGPRLNDIGAGRYALVPLEGADGAVPPPFVHLCVPAAVQTLVRQ
jgi:hypothetical protein